ncbi:MAG TPA: hypothetical protein VGP07_05290 [Polyangia bacterium]
MLQGISRPVFLGMGVLASLALVGCGGGSSGRPGSNTGGSTGSGGAATGVGGAAAGSSGAAGAASMALPCTANPTTALISNFLGAAAGDGGVAANGHWGTTGQITGSVFGYPGTKTNDAGVMSNITALIDKDKGTLTLSGPVVAGDYGGGGMAFDTCVDTTNWTGVKFTLGGTADGCTLTFQLQTESQEPTSRKGTCTASSCYDFPQLKVPIPTDGSATVVTFDSLTATGMPSAPADFEKEMFGLQWQFTSAAPTTDGSAQQGCMPAMTISDVEWVSN